MFVWRLGNEDDKKYVFNRLIFTSDTVELIKEQNLTERLLFTSSDTDPLTPDTTTPNITYSVVR